jgi:hypothetical protein
LISCHALGVMAPAVGCRARQAPLAAAGAGAQQLPGCSGGVIREPHTWWGAGLPTHLMWHRAAACTHAELRLRVHLSADVGSTPHGSRQLGVGCSDPALADMPSGAGRYTGRCMSVLQAPGLTAGSAFGCSPPHVVHCYAWASWACSCEVGLQRALCSSCMASAGVQDWQSCGGTWD